MMVKCKMIHMKDWNDLFNGELKFRRKVFERYEGKKYTFLGCAVYIWQERSCAYCYYADINKNTSHFYKTTLDHCNDDEDVNTSGGNALISLIKTVNDNAYMHCHEEEDAPLSAAGILYFNEKYNNTRHYNCIGYDRNSAYPWAMLQDMPDTTSPLGPGIIQPGQVGFSPDAGVGYMMHFEGFAPYRFPLRKTPFEKFVNKWYDKKKNAVNKQEKQRAKGMLNYSIGALQHCNCFLRAAIIEYSNQFMLRIINKYPEKVLFSNTDSIVATEPIPEIEKELGLELGQWKIEHRGDFAYKGLQYQWNVEKDIAEVSYRGVPKKWFENIKHYDILKDFIPRDGNDYVLTVEGTICLKTKESK